jgi:hypothetical protein
MLNLSLVRLVVDFRHHDAVSGRVGQDAAHGSYRRDVRRLKLQSNVLRAARPRARVSCIHWRRDAVGSTYRAVPAAAVVGLLAVVAAPLPAPVAAPVAIPARTASNVRFHYYFSHSSFVPRLGRNCRKGKFPAAVLGMCLECTSEPTQNWSPAVKRQFQLLSLCLQFIYFATQLAS